MRKQVSPNVIICMTADLCHPWSRSGSQLSTKHATQTKQPLHTARIPRLPCLLHARSGTARAWGLYRCRRVIKALSSPRELPHLYNSLTTEHRVEYCRWLSAAARTGRPVKGPHQRGDDRARFPQNLRNTAANSRIGLLSLSTKASVFESFTCTWHAQAVQRHAAKEGVVQGRSRCALLACPARALGSCTTANLLIHPEPLVLP